MIKQLLHSLILFSAFAQAFIQPLINIEYQLRKEYIVAELCKERYATINTCDGRCFLVKKLNAAQQQESEEKERNIKPVEINLRLSEIGSFFEDQLILTPSSPSSLFYLPNYSYLEDQSKDEPPRV